MGIERHANPEKQAAIAKLSAERRNLLKEIFRLEEFAKSSNIDSGLSDLEYAKGGDLEGQDRESRQNAARQIIDLNKKLDEITIKLTELGHFEAGF